MKTTKQRRYFGNKNLPDNPETKMNEEAIHGHKPQSQWNDPLAEAVAKKSKENIGRVLYRDKWVPLIEKYCTENNITPDQLIEQHRAPLWGFFYNSCVHESAAGLQSAHRSIEGAMKAMQFHKEENRKHWQRIVDSDEDRGTVVGYDVVSPFGIHEDWFVREITVQE